VLVCLAPDFPMRANVLDGLAVDQVIVENAGDGMSASIRAGVAALGSETGVMILPADMPEIDTADMCHVLAAFADTTDRIMRGASADGIPGHPVLFPRRLFSRLKKLRGDQGARDILAGDPAQIVALPAQHAVTDLDTPEDWTAWRAARGG